MSDKIRRRGSRANQIKGSKESISQPRTSPRTPRGSSVRRQNYQLSKVVLVGDSSLSLKIAKRLAKNKASILIVSHITSPAEPKADQLSPDVWMKRGATKFVHVKMDLTDITKWKELSEKWVKEFGGGVDALIYTHGYYYESLLSDVEDISVATDLMNFNYCAPVSAISNFFTLLATNNGQVGLVLGHSSSAPKTLYKSSMKALEVHATKIIKANDHIGLTLIHPGMLAHPMQKTINKLKKADSQISSQTVRAMLASICKKKPVFSPKKFLEATKSADSQGYNLVLIEPPKFAPTNPLLQCIWDNNKVEFREVLKNPALLAELDEDKRNCLHYAAYSGNLDMMNVLLGKMNKQKDIINHRDIFKYTPLHMASRQGHLRMTKLLLQNAADPNALTHAGFSVLHFLAKLNPSAHDQADAAKILSLFRGTLKKCVDLGADVNQRNADWSTPVHEATKANSLVALDFFLKNEGDVHRRTRKGRETPLQLAMKPDNEVIIKKLLEAGADPVDCFDSAPPAVIKLLEEYRECNRVVDEDPDAIPTEKIFVSSIDDLPARELKSLSNTGLLEPGMKELINSNFPIFVHALRFITHKNYVIPNAKQSKKAKYLGSRANLGISIDDAGERFISNGNPMKLFKMSEQIGKGGFGSVFSATRLDTKQTIAIKRVPHHTDKEKWRNYDEIYFLQQSAHANVIKYHSAYFSRDEIWITMDFLAGGSLSEAVSRQRFEERHICYVTKMILLGLKAIHAKNFIHRDLKSSNIMLGVNGDIAIIDFGLCTLDVEGVITKHMVGSPYWIPPEMIRSQPYNKSADIWSLGILCLEMANRKMPAKTGIETMFKAGIGVVPHLEDDRWSPEFKHFMTRMLVFDPAQRATVTELLQDPWMKKSDTRRGMRELLQHVFVERSLETLLV